MTTRPAVNVRIKQPLTNKVFTCRHTGHYLTGYSVVIATSKGHAKDLLTEELARDGLNIDKDELQIDEVDLSQSRAIVLFNGDY